MMRWVVLTTVWFINRLALGHRHKRRGAYKRWNGVGAPRNTLLDWEWRGDCECRLLLLARA